MASVTVLKILTLLYIILVHVTLAMNQDIHDEDMLSAPNSIAFTPDSVLDRLNTGFSTTSSHSRLPSSSTDHEKVVDNPLKKLKKSNPERNARNTIPGSIFRQQLGASPSFVTNRASQRFVSSSGVDLNKESMHTLFRQIYLKKPTILDLSGSQIDDEATDTLIETLPLFRSLKTIILRGTQFSRKMAPLISSALEQSTVEQIDISCEKGVFFAGSANFKISKTSLTSLTLRYASIRLDQAKALFLSMENSALRSFDFSRSRIYSMNPAMINIRELLLEYAEHFSRTRIEQLNLTDSFLSFRYPEPGFELGVRRLISSFFHLKTLSLGASDISSSQLKGILSALNKQRLKALDLSRNQLSDNACEMIGHFISGSVALEFLDLSKNRFTDKCLLYLSAKLPLAKKLRVLKIGTHKWVNYHGLDSLFRSLDKTSIKELYLDDIQFNDNNFNLLSKYISNIKNLHLLDISQSYINEDTRIRLKNLLVQNQVQDVDI